MHNEEWRILGNAEIAWNPEEKENGIHLSDLAYLLGLGISTLRELSAFDNTSSIKKTLCILMSFINSAESFVFFGLLKCHPLLSSAIFVFVFSIF